jgi:hypothetical protein
MSRLVGCGEQKLKILEFKFEGKAHTSAHSCPNVTKKLLSQAGAQPLFAAKTRNDYPKRRLPNGSIEQF